MGILEDMQARAAKSLADRTAGNKAVAANGSSSRAAKPAIGSAAYVAAKSTEKNDGRKLDSDSRFASGSKLQLTVELNEAKQGIELIFSDKPIQMVLDLLHTNGFRWNGATRRWWIKDSQAARDFIAKRFGAQFDAPVTLAMKDPDPVQTGAIPEITPVMVPVGSIPDSAPLPTGRATLPTGNDVKFITTTGEYLQPDYEEYRKQVNELLVAFQMEPADLMLMAVNFLYKNTIEAN